MTLVLTLLAYGCPVPAIVAAFEFDERTVSDWQEKAGVHAKAVQEALVCNGQVELGQVQGDEFYTKTQCGAVWIATAMCVFSWLFLWGAVAIERNSALVTEVVEQVKAAAVPNRPVLWATDGFCAWASAILAVFRTPVYTGNPGRPRLQPWPDLYIVQVVKRYSGRCVTAVERRLYHGAQHDAEELVAVTQVGSGVFNTAYIAFTLISSTLFCGATPIPQTVANLIFCCEGFFFTKRLIKESRVMFCAIELIYRAILFTEPKISQATLSDVSHVLNSRLQYCKYEACVHIVPDFPSSSANQPAVYRSEQAMIHHCTDLRACERILSPLVPTVTLLGQIPVTDEEYTQLTGLIRTKLVRDLSRGTAYLTRWAPTTFACFLVWTGIVGYRNGNYWSAVHEAVGEIDANWQSHWGQFFLRYLQRHHLPQFAIEGCPPYVTPILLHGLLPNACLDAYFTQIVQPLVQRRLVAPQEVRHELQIYRADNEKRQTLEVERTQWQQQQQALDKQIRQHLVLAQEYDTIQRLWALEAQHRDMAQPEPGPAPVVIQQSPDQEAWQALEARLQALAAEQTKYSVIIDSFTETDQRLLAYEDRIVEAVAGKASLVAMQVEVAQLADRAVGLAQALVQQWQQLTALPWEATYGDLIRQLPLDQLALAEKEVGKRAQQLREIQQKHALSQPADTPWLRRTLTFCGLTVVTLLLWLMVRVYVTTRTDLFPFAIASFVIMSGILIANWRMQALHQRQKAQALKRAVDAAAAAFQLAQQQVQSLWGNALGAHGTLAHAALLQGYRELADKYNQVCSIHQQQAQLQEQVNQQQAQLSALVSAVGSSGADALTAVDTLPQALAEAVSRRRAAQQAQAQLTDELLPTLAALQAQQQALCAQSAPTNEQPLSGDSAAAPAEAQVLRTQLAARYPSFAKAERFLRNSGKDKTKLREAAEQSCIELKAVTNRLEAIEHELTYRPSAFAAVDEPIRRFLLHGGEPAEHFLTDSIALLQQTAASGHVVAPDHDRLPQRVVAAFAVWWARQAQTEVAPPAEASPPMREQFRTPVVLLDPGLAEVLLQLPAQRWPDRGLTAPVSYSVTSAESPTVVARIPLRAYRPGTGVVETAAVTHVLPFPAATYHIALWQGEEERQHWTITLGQPTIPYLAFDWQSKKLLTTGALPAEKVWLLAPKAAVITPATCVLQQAALHGRWSAYDLCGLDLTTVAELLMKVGNQTVRCYPAAPTASVKLELVGNEPALTVQSAGAPVYIGAPPRLRIPVSDSAELPAWRLSLRPETADTQDEHQVYRLSELHQIIALAPAEGWAELPLADGRLLGPTPTGCFVLRVWKPPYIERELRFAVTPRLAFAFDRTLYFPHQPAQRTPVARLELNLGHATTFLPKAPAHPVPMRQPSCAITTPVTADAIDGVLQVQQQGQDARALALSFAIPKVVWRLEGLSAQADSRWHDTPEEIWFGDWERAAALFLVVKLPPHMQGQLALTLEHGTVQQQSVLRDGIVRFDLLALRDALVQGPAVQALQLSHLNSAASFTRVPLLCVRTKWQADAIECIQQFQGRTINLSVRWLDRGKAEAKRIYLWSLTDSPLPILACDVAGEAQHAEVKASAATLLPGTYLLQIVAVDPWATAEPVRPTLAASNIQRFDIVSAGALRQGEIFTITAVADLGQRYQPQLVYQLKVEGKIVHHATPATHSGTQMVVTYANEGWYIGRLLRPAVATNDQIDRTLWDELLASNPFKIEYNVTKGVVTTIENRYGEGPMYCPTCGRLYWRQETIDAETSAGHPLVGPIELFYIDWQS